MQNAQIQVAIASGFDEMVQAIAIRSAVYVGEKGWSFKEEWDGNDFTCTHLLAKVGGESAGTLRIRYFGDFVKVERLAVLPHFRQKRYGRKGVAFELGDYAIDFCLKKGFRRIYGHALEELVPFWQKIGRGHITPLDGASFSCGDKAVIAMFGELPPDPSAITKDSDPYITVRPEGHLDRPGFWELANGAH
ncbi:MAG: GNAT family N-acetyltransferase [Rhodospirillaceae bacterium]|nr:GNAT family N-acetyltransferase [Rhodospirillales bacterium]